MKMLLGWLGANLVILAIGACAGACALAVLFFFQWIDLPEGLWPYAGIPAIAATIAGTIYGGRGVLWLMDRIGNRAYYRKRAGK
jgi:hypothetical protein